MRTSIFFTIPIFLILAVNGLTSCKKENSSSPCNPAKGFEADIQIGYKFLNGDFVSSDTLINFSVFIDADSIYQSYNWKVGNDTTIRTTKSFTLRFNIAQLGETIPVTLIAKGIKNPCNPLDDGIDTVHRSFTLLYSNELNELNNNIYPSTFCIDLPIFGDWKGAFADNTTDSFIVTVNNNGVRPPNMGDRFFGFRLYNLPKGCSVKQQNGIATCGPVTDTIQKYFGYHITEISHNGFYIEPQLFMECCPNISMSGSLNTSTGIITIKCIYLNGAGGILQTRIFQGNKY